MNATVGIIVMCTVGASGTLVVAGSMVYDMVQDWKDRKRIDRLTEPGEWPEEFNLKASECHREGRRTAW